MVVAGFVPSMIPTLFLFVDVRMLFIPMAYFLSKFAPYISLVISRFGTKVPPLVTAVPLIEDFF